jgi:hypothetical protein
MDGERTVTETEEKEIEKQTDRQDQSSGESIIQGRRQQQTWNPMRGGIENQSADRWMAMRRREGHSDRIIIKSDSISKRTKFIALQHDPIFQLQTRRDLRHLWGIKIFKLVRRHGGVEVREQRRDGQRVRRPVRRLKQMLDRRQNKVGSAMERCEIKTLRRPSSAA